MRMLSPGLAEGNCTDFKKQMVANGERYVPLGFDACTTCTCHNGEAGMCIAVLCSPPKDCQNTQLADDKCCEFMCKNGDVDRPPLFNVTTISTKETESLNPTNLGLRLVASTVTSFLILALLLFMIHRLRQRRLLLMIRRINNGHVNGYACRRGRLSIDDDRTVGYFPDQDHVDFGMYDDPPPPYTFWKPPESYFPQGEAPPPYETALNVNGFIPHHNVTGGTPTITHSLGPCLSHPLQIPSLSNVPLHANNFQMNDLGQESSAGQPRHSLPLDHLNVMCSMSSLSSQSELNLNEASANLNSGDNMALRSDATYEDCPSYNNNNSNNLNLQSNSSETLAASYGSLACNGGDQQQSKIDVDSANFNRGSNAHKCHSYNNVLDSWQQDKTPDPEIPNDLKRYSLQANVTDQRNGGMNFYPDPTKWNGDASESSSSSSPTYEQRTVSPTSSDSSSLDYPMPSSVVDRGRLVSLPRRANSDHQVRQARLLPTAKASSGGAGPSSVEAPTAGAPKSNSLDRTLNQLKQRISLKKKPWKQSDKGTEQTSSNNSNAAATSASLDSRLLGKKPYTLSAASTSRFARRSRSHDATPVDEASPMVTEGTALSSVVNHIPRISYVSDGQQDGASGSGGRPKSYDFGDLSSLTYTLSEEVSTGVRVSGSDSNKFEVESARTDCGCSLSSDRPCGSGSPGSVTCSSRASFGSMGSSPSHEAPASPSSLCSPYTDDSASVEHSSASHSASATVAPVHLVPPPPRTHNPHVTPVASAANPLIPLDALLHSRSGSICSETGERKPRGQQQQQSSLVSPQSEGGAVAAAEMPSASSDSAIASRMASNETWQPSHHLHGHRPNAAAQQIRINLGTWKQNQESYI